MKVDIINKQGLKAVRVIDSSLNIFIKKRKIINCLNNFDEIGKITVLEKDFINDPKSIIKYYIICKFLYYKNDTVYPLKIDFCNLSIFFKIPNYIENNILCHNILTDIYNIVVESYQ